MNKNQLSLIRILAVVICILGVMAGSVSLSFARTETIAVVVNDDAITRSELQDRVKLTLVSSGLPDNDEIREKVTGQVVTSLIEEQLMMQEAEKNGIEVPDVEVQAGFANLAEQNNASAEQFKAMIGSSGVNVETMFRQIRAQLAWSKFVQTKLRARVQVTDKDVDNELELLRSNLGEAEYLVAEIFLPVEEQGEEKKVKDLAVQLVNDMKAGKVPFMRAAQQFSKSAGASKGGDIGWVQKRQLASELGEALAGMEKNSLSAPIRTLRGYHILLLRDTRTLSEDNIPPREKVVEKIGVERLQRIAQRHLLDLKKAAFIDNRV